jgi:sporulation protein YlmC with PRC-barrel domain
LFDTTPDGVVSLEIKTQQRILVMTKTLLKISAVCAVCSLLSTAAWAQSDSQDKPVIDQNKPANTVSPIQNNRSWSTKHLSATGRTEDTAVRASKLIGAQVTDISGHHAGQIEDIIVNPVSGRIDFALLSLGAPGSSAKLVPVPWPLFRTTATSQYNAGAGQPTFTLNAEQSKLNSAPAVDWSDLSQSEWRQRIYSYYGVTPQPSVGGAESPSGVIRGQGAMRMPPGPVPESQPPQSQQKP